MIQILIADDFEKVRKGISQLLHEAFHDINVVEACDTNELLEHALNQHWDFIIVDIVMPGSGGIEAMKKIKEHNKSLPVLVISTYPQEQYSRQVIAAGADGFLNKADVSDQLVYAIQHILSGNKYYGKEISAGS